MTSTTLTAIPQRRAPFQGHLSQWRVTVSEFTKLRSLRSTSYSLLAAVVLTIGLSAVAATVTASHWTSMSLHDRATFDAQRQHDRRYLRPACDRRPRRPHRHQ